MVHLLVLDGRGRDPNIERFYPKVITVKCRNQAQRLSVVIARFWCAYLRVRLSTGALINEYKKSARKKRKKNLIIFFRWCIFFFVYPFVHFIFLNLHQLLNRQKKYQNEHHFVRTQHHSKSSSSSSLIKWNSLSGFGIM